MVFVAGVFGKPDCTALLDNGIRVTVQFPSTLPTGRQPGTKRESHMRRRVLALVVPAIWFVGCAAQGALQPKATPVVSSEIQNGVPRSECFPVSQLSPEDRSASEELLLKALDNEALYTFVGNLKPVSDLFEGSELTIETARPDLGRISQARKWLSAWRCGTDLYGDVQIFGFEREGRRSADLFVANVPALARLMTRHADFFGRYALTPNAHPLAIMMAVEYADTSARWRGYGYVFGYPDYAVDFFVSLNEENDRKRAAGLPVGTPDEHRDFVRVPTYAVIQLPGGRTGGFRWSVAKGHQENDEDKAIKASAAAILDAYKTRRARYIGPGKPGAFSLLRDWYCSSGPRCSPSNAKPN